MLCKRAVGNRARRRKAAVSGFSYRSYTTYKTYRTHALPHNLANNSPTTANNRQQLGPVGLCWRELPIRWQVLHNPFSAWNELGRNVERAIAKIFTTLR